MQYDRGQRYFEDEIVQLSSLDDLDDTLINDYKDIMDISELSSEEVLKARNLLIDGKLTNAGILLFGKNPSKFLPQARLRVIKYNGMHQMVGTEINIIKEAKYMLKNQNQLTSAELYDNGLMETLISNAWLDKLSEKYTSLIDLLQEHLKWNSELAVWENNNNEKI